MRNKGPDADDVPFLDYQLTMTRKKMEGFVDHIVTKMVEETKKGLEKVF